MRILLDTHVLLWTLGDPARLRAVTRDQIASPDNVILFSAISLLEIAVKFARKRPDFRVHPEEVLQHALAARFEELPVSASMTLKVADLPRIHGDPFDRLLLAQALAAQCRLYTVDAKLLAYGDPATPA